MEGLKSITPILSANDCLIRNDVIRRYVRSIDIKNRQLFTQEVGTIDFKPSILTLGLVLAFGSFANFENDPYSPQRHRYRPTSHPEISKLSTLSQDRMTVCLSFSTKYARVKIMFSQKSPSFLTYTFFFESAYFFYFVFQIS